MNDVRTREPRDPEATAFAEETVKTLDVTPESRGVAWLAIFRGFAKGKIVGFKSRDREVEELHARLWAANVDVEKMKRSNEGSGLKYATNFTPAESSYIATINKYGMTPKEIAAVFSCEVIEIEEVLSNLRSGPIRFKHRYA